jgi:hypothetical protein
MFTLDVPYLFASPVGEIRGAEKGIRCNVRKKKLFNLVNNVPFKYFKYLKRKER